MPAHAGPAQPTDLFLLQDLGNVDRTSGLPHGDLDALRTVGNWITSFITRPHKDLGRAGPVCPFVPVSLDRKTLWLAPEHVGDRSLPEIVDLIGDYQRRFLGAPPTGDDAIYKAIVVVFIDLRPDAAGALFDHVLGELAVPSYLADGFVMGGSYEGNAAGAIYNPSFLPFTSPVPFLLIRPTVASDWEFLDDDAWLERWAQHHRESGAEAVARELRHLPWRTQRA